MKKDSNKRIDEILGSLDGSPKAAAPDFFYTRLVARMEKGLAPVPPKSWILRPVFAFSVLVVVLVINAFVILKSGNSNGENGINETEALQSIAAEFELNDNNYVYNLNQDK